LSGAEICACAGAVADWGTSNLRIWLLDGDGRVLARAASADGADRIDPDGFEAVLRAKLVALGASWPAETKLPVVICGMAGARNGWRETGYVAVPAAPTDCLRPVVGIEAVDLDIRIMPGLSKPDAQNPDVMRGEETQLLGFTAAEPDFSGLLCMPGTHSKWVRFAQGRIVNFHTAITGELFALLSGQSVLRHVIGHASGFTADHPAFESGLAVTLVQPERLMLDLFPVRAAGLLGGQTGAAAAARLSGLLIGAEIALSLAGALPAAPVVLVAAGKLAPLYARALTRAGRDVRLFDAEELVLDGLRTAARLLFPRSFKE
jgi:2-dehydro-3-deoxygalactonokinase